ncbi:Bug family tripartite tricarboxylate transporter substrate binding protein [Bordetella bronchiseptica]|uniref:Bug family tripartite tricarboxylate transporter substrate binding protein n=1 Tax=Bordetella bronchiseptica TaxID=518 RepID=UPI00028B45BE|nr:tripartite tricarboxylate transporter substrate-binding protein [Bordetella bronchiseptica]KCV26024.1 tripartite tricarboxylate transporter family receptor [Bordetella bronchiseptica 00-P-2730]KDD62270.1 tripartite tricarboxylate transporter family receptor [Bordetella bronchiseptica OSU553]AUL14584.1 LacI family transcriptional regulator [Bordetella bronchiseptica]AWP57675.1 LacI family transcriptional regulator [Bordetella bronchiseptica]AWQ04408.1 LacI family transcriptional regulator [B
MNFFNFGFQPGAAHTRRRVTATVLALAAWAALPVQQAAAQPQWPQRPVTLIVPFAPGGPTDVTARVLGEALGKEWKQTVVIENRAGAGGTVGAGFAAKAAPDGYTLLLGVTGSHGIAGSLYPSLTYDPKGDFEAISKVVFYPNAIIANPDVPANNLQELIALAKKDPKYQVYGTDGNGTASHLTMELLRERGGFTMQAVQYKGASPLINDIVAGFVPVGITGFPSAEPQVKAGKLKLIALTTDKDYSGNGYPTIAGQGFPGFAAAPWSGIFAPKGTPAPIVQKIAADIKTAMASPAVVEKMQTLGLTPSAVTLADFEAELDRERASWATAVKISGAKVQ